MGFTTTKGSTKLKHMITAPASQHFQHIREDAPQLLGEVCSLKECMRITIHSAYAALPLNHLAKIDSIGIHGKLSLHNVVMRSHHAIPCGQSCSYAVLLCCHSYNPSPLILLLFRNTRQGVRPLVAF